MYYNSEIISWPQKIIFSPWTDLIEPQQIIFRYSEVKVLLIISKIWVYQVNITFIIDPAIQVTPLLNAVIIYLRVYSLHHNVLPTLQSIPLMTNGPLYPITQDSSCHGQHTMPRSPWSFPWPVPHSCVLHECVCVLQWRKLCVVVL